MQDFSDNPPKKPVATVGSTGDLYRRSAIQHWLSRAEVEPNSKKRKDILDYVLELTRPLRDKAAGFAWQGAVAIIGATVVLLLYVARLEQQHTWHWVAPADKFQILKRFDAYNYQFRHIHSENGQITSNLVHAKFCPDDPPPFSAGQTLTRLVYRDMGGCWFIHEKGLGYDFELDERGHDSLAPNCHDDRPITYCEPNETEAIFREEN